METNLSYLLMYVAGMIVGYWLHSLILMWNKKEKINSGRVD